MTSDCRLCYATFAQDFATQFRHAPGRKFAEDQGATTHRVSKHVKRTEGMFELICNTFAIFHGQSVDNVCQQANVATACQETSSLEGPFNDHSS